MWTGIKTLWSVALLILGMDFGTGLTHSYLHESIWKRTAIGMTITESPQRRVGRCSANTIIYNAWSANPKCLNLDREDEDDELTRSFVSYRHIMSWCVYGCIQILKSMNRNDLALIVVDATALTTLEDAALQSGIPDTETWNMTENADHIKLT